MVSQEDKSTDCHQMILMDFCRKNILKTNLWDLQNAGVSNWPHCRSDGVGTVTQEEKEKFTEIKERLRVQLEYQLTNFRWSYNPDQNYFIMRTNWNITIQILLSLWSARGRSQIYALPSRTGKQIGWCRTYLRRCPHKISNIFKIF